MKRSLFLRAYVAVILLISSMTALLVWGISQQSDLDVLIPVLLILFVILAWPMCRWLFKPLNETLEALDTGVSSFKDNDFSLTIQNRQYSEIEQFITMYNELATILRSERMDLFQRELLLDTVIQSTPVALVLTNRNEHIVYSNAAAKEFLQAKKKLEGNRFSTFFPAMSPAVLAATVEKHNGLITDAAQEEAIIYNVNCRQFVLNGQSHHLYLYKNLTTEISRKKSDMWKQVIRLISHELNNSLAPIASLTHSAKKIMDRPEHVHMLEEVLDTIGKRTEHLHQFISQYAEFAKLPEPNVSDVDIPTFFEHIKRLCEVKCEYDCVSSTAQFDAAQIEQVIINLVKNAKESGSAIEDVAFNLSQEANLLVFTVCDRGTGLTEAQIKQALLPFYTTKSTGTGVGLALCNEVVIAHNGKLRLLNREAGGLCVSFSLRLH